MAKFINTELHSICWCLQKCKSALLLQQWVKEIAKASFAKNGTERLECATGPRNTHPMFDPKDKTNPQILMTSIKRTIQTSLKRKPDVVMVI